MLMITSSPAPDSASSVTSVWRLSCHRPTTFAFSRTFVHAVLNVVTGRVGSFGCPLPAGKTYHSGLHSPNRWVYQAACASRATRTVSLSGIKRPVRCGCFRLAHRERLLVYEIDLLPPEFAQFFVAQSAVQIHHQGGVHVLAPQLRSFRKHARLLVGRVGASRRWRG